MISLLREEVRKMAKITFESIAGGELAERFRVALAQIGRNIMDPNSDPDASRGMTINLKFKPNESGGINVEFDIKTKLAGFRKENRCSLLHRMPGPAGSRCQNTITTVPRWQYIPRWSGTQKRTSLLIRRPVRSWKRNGKVRSI